MLERKAKRAGVPMQHKPAKIDPSDPIILDTILYLYISFKSSISTATKLRYVFLKGLGAELYGL